MSCLHLWQRSASTADLGACSEPPPEGTAGCQIKAMSHSPDGRTIIVGGQDLLKLVQLKGAARAGEARLEEGKAVRTGKKKNLNYAVQDLAWHPADPTVASASTNGAVVLWHVERLGGGGAGRLSDVLNGHKRAVNRVCWHPSNPALLLSASQDQSVRLWDVRAGGGAAIQSATAFRAGADLAPGTLKSF